MMVEDTNIKEVKILIPNSFNDFRGEFFESWNHKLFTELIGNEINFIQDNHSKSKRGVLRGLHYQLDPPQSKLVRVICGEIYDVAVDLREGSKTYGKHVGVYLSKENRKQLWIPAGFAHGFLVMSNQAEVLYKTDNYYSPSSEHSIIWDDPDLNIDWPIENSSQVIISDKDKNAKKLNNSPVISI